MNCRPKVITGSQLLVAGVGLVCALRAAPPPVLFHTDLESGPNKGGQNGRGAFVTLYGRNFGSARGPGGKVTVGGGVAEGYPVWSDTRITIQLGEAVHSGPIMVWTAHGSSNSVPFTVRPGRICFVSLSGSDSGGGSFEKPWRTIVKCKNALLPGDICYVGDGVEQVTEDKYQAALIIDSSGEPGRSKALISYPGARVTVGRAEGMTAGGTPLSFGLRTPNLKTPNSHWVIAGMKFQGEVAMAVTAGATDWRVVGNEFTCPAGNGGAACFESSKASHIAFLSNEVHDAGCSDRTIPCATNQGRGRIHAKGGSNRVTGASTRFRQGISPGMQIQIGPEWRTVVKIDSDASLTVDEPLAKGATEAPWRFMNGPGRALSEGNLLILPSAARPWNGGGRVSAPAGSTQVHGVGTAFTQQLVAMADHSRWNGSVVRVGDEERIVAAIESDSELTVSAPFTRGHMNESFTYRQEIFNVIAGDSVGFADGQERSVVYANRATSSILLDRPLDRPLTRPTAFYHRHTLPSKLYHSVYFSTDSTHLDVGWNFIHDNRACRGIQFHSSPTTSIPPPAAPAMAVAPGGDLAPRRYSVRVSYTQTCVRSAGCVDGWREGRPGVEVTHSVPAGRRLVVKAPVNPCGGLAACTAHMYYNVYVGISSGTERLQNSAPIPISDSWTEDPAGLRPGRPPAGNRTLYADGFAMHDIKVHDNFVLNQVCDGINLATVEPAAGPVVVYNNIVVNAGAGPDPPPDPAGYHGIYIPGVTNNGPTPRGAIEVYNNTFIGVGTRHLNYPALPPFSSAGVLGLGNTLSDIQVKFYNNLISQPEGAMPMLSGMAAERRVEERNTLYYQAGSGRGNENPARIPQDPRFVDADGLDFRLRPGSPAIDQGRPLPFESRDYAGVRRPQGRGVDIGAFEYTPGSEAVRLVARRYTPESRREAPGRKAPRPATPTDLTVTVQGNGSALVRWRTPQKGEAGFQLERCMAERCRFETIAVLPAGTSSYTDEGAGRGGAFMYRIRCVSEGGYSDYSPLAKGLSR